MNGVLIIDKPKGITSHDVVYMVRKKLGIKKVGHTGTLDPMATGVLPILVGRATKISDNLTAHDKHYIAEFEFGYETDTLDVTGEVLKRTDNIPTIEELKSVLPKFLGKIEQKVPIYSAIKVNGKKLYEYARSGEEVEVPTKKCEIYEISLIDEKIYTISVKCSSGTYIRSLIRDIGYELNSLCTMTELRRVQSGDFLISQSVAKDEFEKLNTDELLHKLIPMDRALSLPQIHLRDLDFDKIVNGMLCKSKEYDKNLEYNIYCKGEYIGIGRYMYHKGIWGIKIVKLLRVG